MDPLKLRQDFPVLAGDDPPVYLDNACMPMKPEPVLRAMDDYYRHFPTCGGRSLHRLAFDVTERYETARGQLQRFVGATDASEAVVGAGGKGARFPVCGRSDILLGCAESENKS